MKEFADDEDVKQPSTREFHNGGEDRILKVANDRLPTDFELCQLRLTLLAWSVSKIRVPNRMINSALIGTPSMRKRKEAMDNVSLCTLHKLLALPTSSNSWDGHGCRRELETDVYVSTICLDSLNIMCIDALHTIAQFSKTLNLLLKSLNVFSCLSVGAQFRPRHATGSQISLLKLSEGSSRTQFQRMPFGAIVHWCCCPAETLKVQKITGICWRQSVWPVAAGRVVRPTNS